MVAQIVSNGGIKPDGVRRTNPSTRATMLRWEDRERFSRWQTDPNRTGEPRRALGRESSSLGVKGDDSAEKNYVTRRIADCNARPT